VALPLSTSITFMIRLRAAAPAGLAQPLRKALAAPAAPAAPARSGVVHAATATHPTWALCSRPRLRQ
jgi:hypothetical protein